MQGIYKITNKTNGNSYIGQSVDIAKRWREHTAWSTSIKRLEYQYPLYRAIRKYGLENFTFEVIEIVNIREELTAKEVYWYSLLNPEYNQVLPTVSPINIVNEKRKRKVLKIDADTKMLICEYESIRDAARENNVNHKSISDTCKGFQKHAAGYLWKYKPGE